VEGGGDGEREGKAEEVGLIYEKGLLRRAPCFVCLDGWFCCLFLGSHYLVSWVYGLIWV